MSEWRKSAVSGKQAPGKPPSPEELGAAGWTVLHTAAAAFPNTPSQEQQLAMKAFIESWSKVYACSHCAYHMRTVLSQKPPIVTSKRAVSQYVCELHNDVNYMLGKDVYDCNPDVVLKRWHPTYPNMEDVPTIEEQIAEDRRKSAEVAAAKRRESEGAAQSNSGSGGGSDKGMGWGWRRGAGQTESATTTRAASDASSSASGKRVADDDTNVEAVLARLKGCQVYCPEKH